MSHSTTNTPGTPSSRPFRIALGITELDAGGAERQFARLAKGLDRQLFEPHVYCLSGEGPLAGELREAGVPVTFLHARSRWDAGVVRRWTLALREFQPDLLQTFLFHANIAGRMAAWRAGVRHVVSGIRVAEPRRWQLWVDRLADSFVDRHVCVSESVARHSREVAGLQSEKLVVIPNGIEVDQFAGAEPVAWPFMTPGMERPRVVLFVGRLEAQKNPGLLLEAVHLARERLRGVEVAFVGSGSLEGELREQARAWGVPAHWLGRRSDVAGLMRSADCLALPSRWEGMPNVVLEAFASGLPVVACRVEGLTELFGEEGGGILVEQESVGEFADALVEVVENQEKWRGRATKSQDFIRERFTSRNMILSYQNLFLDLINSASPPGEAKVKVGPQTSDEKNWENLQSQPG